MSKETNILLIICWDPGFIGVCLTNSSCQRNIGHSQTQQDWVSQNQRNNTKSLFWASCMVQQIIFWNLKDLCHVSSELAINVEVTANLYFFLDKFIPWTFSCCQEMWDVCWCVFCWELWKLIKMTKRWGHLSQISVEWTASYFSVF